MGLRSLNGVRRASRRNNMLSTALAAFPPAPGFTLAIAGQSRGRRTLARARNSQLNVWVSSNEMPKPCREIR